MTELEKGYVAGIIDGEGTITLTKIHANDKFRAPSIEITSTTYTILEMMKNLFGGTISKITTKKENWKQAYKWNLRYDKAIDMLKEISNYLLEPVKKQRAELIINEYKKVTPRNGKYNEEKLKQKIQFEENFFNLK